MAKNNKRVATVLRKTAETDIALSLVIDGRGRSEIDTGVPFFDHMLTLFAKHGLFDLTVKAKGDVEVDYHHTVEDVGLVLGQAFKEALGDKVGIKRYGFLFSRWTNRWPASSSMSVVARIWFMRRTRRRCLYAISISSS